VVDFDVCQNAPKLIGYHSNVQTYVSFVIPIRVTTYAERLTKIGLWWCYRANVCAIGITSLSLSDSCNISFILSHSESPNHQPTDTLSLSQSTQLQRTDVPRWHDEITALHTTVQSLIYEVDLAYQPTRWAACWGCQRQPGSATFQTRGPRPCGGWKNPAGTLSPLQGKASGRKTWP